MSPQLDKYKSIQKMDRQISIEDSRHETKLIAAKNYTFLTNDAILIRVFSKTRNKLLISTLNHLRGRNLLSLCCCIYF
jgi:hypothetical protein